MDVEYSPRVRSLQGKLAKFFDEHIYPNLARYSAEIDTTNLIFNQFDLILFPNYPTTAFRLGEKLSDPVEMYAADIFTVFSNLTGLPSISLPLFWHNNGLPYGVQIMSNRFRELYLLSVSNQWMHQFRVSGHEKPEPTTPATH